MNKKICIGFGYSHHGTHTGYNQLMKYVDYKRYLDTNKIWVLKFFNLFQPHVQKYIYFEKWYNLLCANVTKILCISQKNCAFHFIYGESFFFTRKHLHKSNKIVVTLHLPSKNIHDLNKKYTDRIKEVDLAIVMSRKLKEFYNAILPEKKVVYIPHGVDIDYFCPDNSLKKVDRIILVGGHLRNFQIASEVFEYIHNIQPAIEMVVVTAEEERGNFSGQPYVKFYSGIPDDFLLELYQTSKILFLPLKSFTANNAVLEAAACGCDIYLNTQINDESYFSFDQIHFIEGSVSEIATTLINGILNFNEENQKKLIDFVRNEYSWEAIAKTTEAEIDKLFEKEKLPGY